MLRAYEHPSLWLGLWQAGSTAAAVLLGLGVLAWLLRAGAWWAMPPLVLLVGGLMIRTCCLMHDCGHRALFRGRRLNDAIGTILGLLVMTPFHYWRDDHSAHHAASGNLDRRGTGDVWTMTVAEYQAASPRRRLAYRLFRNSWIMIGLGAPFYCLVRLRYVTGSAANPRMARRSVAGTNLALAAIAGACAALGALDLFLLVWVPCVVVCSGLGIWLFFVQHQFPGTWWARRAEWTHLDASLRGSSFLDLPPVLHWFTANLGFHHVHHFASRIPNHRLPECHRAVAAFAAVRRLRLGDCRGVFALALWDEEQRRLVSFAEASRLVPRQPSRRGTVATIPEGIAS